MQTQRITRINELLKREIASALYRELGDAEVNLAAVTITRVAISSDLHRAHVGVSVRGDDAEWRRTLRALHRHRPALQAAVHRHVILKYTPVLVFERDETIAAGDRILRLIEALPSAAATDVSPEPPPAPEP